MSKFKPGDKVVFYRTESHDRLRDTWIGETLILKELDYPYNNQRWTIKTKNFYWIVRESEIISEKVYNSPLYKALEENES